MLLGPLYGHPVNEMGHPDLAMTIQQLLGHAHLDHTDAYLDTRAEVLEAMFAGAP